jgi:hypothetical protein
VLIKEGKRGTRKAVAKYLAVHRNTIGDKAQATVYMNQMA